VIAATVGAYFLSSAGKGLQFQNGDSLELIGAIFWGMHFVVLGKFASRFEPISFAAGQFLVTGLLNFAMGLVFEHLGQLTPLPMIGAIPVPGQPVGRDRLYPAGVGPEAYHSHGCRSYPGAGSRFRCPGGLAGAQAGLAAAAGAGLRHHPGGSDVLAVEGVGAAKA